MIAALYIPYFLAALCPAPEHQPLLITTPAGRRVVASCERAAGTGVRPGMTPRQALALIPHAVVRPYEPANYHVRIEQALETLADFTSNAELEAELYLPERSRTLDFRQDGVLYADLGQLQADDLSQLTQALGAALRNIGLRGTLGLAAHRFTAYAAAAMGTSDHLRTVPEGEEATFLAPLPLTLLRTDGEVARRLSLFGLKTLGEFAALPQYAVYAQFGGRGLRWWDQARGADATPIAFYHPNPTETLRWQFEPALRSRGDLETALRTLGSRLTRRLAGRGLMFRTAWLTLMLEGHMQRTTSITLRTPTAHCEETLLKLAARLTLSAAGIEALSIELLDMTPLHAIQLSLFPDTNGTRTRLSAALRSLVARFGAEPFGWLEQHDPASPLIERRYRRQPIDQADDP